MSATQSVFGVEEHKGVLLVTPGGDAVSYREVDVASEVDRIRNLIDHMDVPRVVVDLAGARYLGSVMIGAISEFAEHVRSRNGRFAVCNASAEMVSVLQVMKLHERWPQFASRHAAVKFAHQ